MTVLPADAVTSAITDELKTRPGIHRAAAALKGSPAAPGLELSVTAADHTDPALLRGYTEGEALTHLRASLERETIPTVLRIRFVPARIAPCYDPGVSRNGELPDARGLQLTGAEAGAVYRSCAGPDSLLGVPG